MFKISTCDPRFTPGEELEVNGFRYVPSWIQPDEYAVPIEVPIEVTERRLKQIWNETWKPTPPPRWPSWLARLFKKKEPMP